MGRPGSEFGETRRAGGRPLALPACNEAPKTALATHREQAPLEPGAQSYGGHERTRPLPTTALLAKETRSV